MLLLKMLASALMGFISSWIGYEPLHEEGVPEILRYASGVMLIAIAMPLFNKDSKGNERDLVSAMLLAALGIGAGVSASRVAKAKCGQQKLK